MTKQDAQFRKALGDPVGHQRHRRKCRLERKCGDRRELRPAAHAVEAERVQRMDHH
jgi:hypothetical protein